MLDTAASILGVILLLFVWPIVAVLGGSFAGWIVGLVFPSTFELSLARFSLDSFQPWQIGAILGFIGGFLKTSVSKN